MASGTKCLLQILAHRASPPRQSFFTLTYLGQNSTSETYFDISRWARIERYPPSMRPKTLEEKSKKYNIMSAAENIRPDDPAQRRDGTGLEEGLSLHTISAWGRRTFYGEPIPMRRLHHNEKCHSHDIVNDYINDRARFSIPMKAH